MYNKLTYFDIINGSMEEIVLYYHEQEKNAFDELTIVIDDELTSEKDEKSFLKWALSYCEGLIEGTHDRHDIFIEKKREDYTFSCNINNVGIKWLEITEDDKYKVTFDFKTTIIEIGND